MWPLSMMLKDYMRSQLNNQVHCFIAAEFLPGERAELQLLRQP